LSTPKVGANATYFCVRIFSGKRQNASKFFSRTGNIQHQFTSFSQKEVMVKQMTGEYACRSNRLHSLNWTCRKLARAVEFSIAYIPREQNRQANQLANDAAKSRNVA
jgi:ribonuclease HI